MTAGLNDQGRQLLTNAVESLVPQLDGTPPALVLNGVSPTTVMKDSAFLILAQPLSMRQMVISQMASW